MLNYEYPNCEKCTMEKDCHFNTQIIEGCHTGKFITPQMRMLCAGTEQDKKVMYVTSWYFYAFFNYAQSGKPYNNADHLAGFVPEIDFAKEVPSMIKYLNGKKNGPEKFRKLIGEALPDSLKRIIISAGPEFKRPMPKDLIYSKANEKQR